MRVNESEVSFYNEIYIDEGGHKYRGKERPYYKGKNIAIQ